MKCSLCDRVKTSGQRTYPYLIHEFKHSFLMLGEHQFYRGYSVLVLKEHYRELSDLPSPMRAEFFQEMIQSEEALRKIFQPHKMNLCSLGNVVDHLHWHFFPRYAEDSQAKNPPWLQMHLFDNASITPEEAQSFITPIQRHLAAQFKSN